MTEQKIAFTFRKHERLRSKKVLDELFNKGKAINLFPFRLVWLNNPEGDFFVKIAISVPKKTFKRAVDRNRIRRLIREAYRQHKHVMYEKVKSGGSKFALLLIYTGKEEPTLAECRDKIILILQRFIKDSCEK